MPSSLADEPSSISQLQGVWTAAITPRRESGHEVDLGSALEIIDFLNGFPIDGIALLGSTGEFVHFDVADRVKFAQMAIRRSRKPVIVNTTHSTYTGTLALSSEALNAGSYAALVMPPYYFRYSQENIAEFFLKLAKDLRGPILLYNIPFFTTPMEPETACELLSTGLFAGIKDSSGREDYFLRLQELPNRNKIKVIIGNDSMFVRGRRQGADGVISGVSAMAPELILSLNRAVNSKNDDEVTRLSSLLTECIDWLDRFPVPAAIKIASNARGLKGGALAIPSCAREKELFHEFESWYRHWLPRINN